MIQIKSEDEFKLRFELTKAKWIVEIPKGGQFHIHYENLNIWQRLIMRCIGWRVTENKNETTN